MTDRLRTALDRLLAPPEDPDRLVAAAPPVAARELVRRFWPDLRPLRRWVVLGIVLASLVPLVEAVEIWLFKLVVDDVLVAKDLGPLPWIAGAYLGLVLLGGALNFADDYVATWIGERFLLRLRTRVYVHLQRLSPLQVDRRRLGDLLSRLSGDVSAIESFVLGGLVEGISSVLRIVFFAGALALLDWRLALVGLLVVPLFYALARRFARRAKHAARERRRRSGSLGAVAEESLGAAALVQAHGREATELARYRREGEGIVQAELASTRISGTYAPLVDLVQLAGVLLVLGLGTWSVSQGDLTVGGLLVFLAYLSKLYGPVRALGDLGQSLFAAAAGAERVLEVLDEAPLVADRPGARRLGRARGAVSLHGVTAAYASSGPAAPALSGVDLAVAPGETVALVGPSGAGKSTVARLLVRFLDPAAGVVRLDGHDLRDLTLASVRANVTLLLQETLLVNGTVRENIAFGRPDATEQEIVAAARAADAHEMVLGLPQGYDTSVGEKGRALSGGQRQRVAMARAFLRDAPVLVLDEPTTGLDAASAARLLGPLRRLTAGRTTIVIAHDLSTVRDADRIVVLDRGRVLETGRHEDLLGRDGLYAALWREHAGERRPEEVAA